ncbi:MAG: hypothetical protein JWP85_1496 [Rhodoglobus sp.]|nr:hypothetical protein [Rhodoglobus sp.]
MTQGALVKTFARLKTLTVVSAWVSAAVAAVPSFLGFADLIRDAGGITALGFLLVGTMATVGGPQVAKIGLRRSRAVRRRWGAIGAVIVSAVYVGSIALIAWLGPNGASPWVWVSLVMYMIVLLTVCAIFVRYDDRAVARASDPAHLAFFGCVFLCGVAAIGLAAAVVHEALQAIWEGDIVTGVAIFMEAAALSATGLALLIARHVVASLALFALGIFLVGYGLASLTSNDTLFGSSVIVAGVATSVLGFALWRDADPGTAIGYFLVGAAAIFFSVASAIEGLRVVAVGAVVLGLILFTMAGITLRVRRTSELFRHPNEVRPWTPRRYLIVATVVGAIAIASAAWAGWLYGTQQGSVVFTAASCAVAAGAISVALVASLGKRPLAVGPPAPAAKTAPDAAPEAAEL